MKYFDWNSLKNDKLKAERGISFEDVVVAIEEGRTLKVIAHPNRAKYPDQSIVIVKINGYAYAVPYVEDETKIFLKTIIPSRQFTKKYLKGKENL